MKKPLVSVVMPAYNCEKYIECALNSVINQTYENLEIIVVDDCSTDGTWNVIQSIAKKDHRIKPFKNDKNKKIVETLNFAVQKATGEYIARTDADDERVVDSIEKQLAVFENDESVVVVGGTSIVCDDNMRPLNKREYPLDDQSIRDRMFRYSPFTGACVVVKASALKDTPFLIEMAEDYESYFRLGKLGKLANIKDTVYNIRTHLVSVSRSRTRYQEKVTLYVRLKAVFEYGYKMTLLDKLYFIAQLATMYMMPSSFRFWVFNKIRGFVK